MRVSLCVIGLAGSVGASSSEETGKSMSAVVPHEHEVCAVEISRLPREDSQELPDNARRTIDASFYDE